MLKTFEEVHKSLDQNAYRLYDNTPRLSIRFGLAEDGNATVHILEDELEVMVINCFTWNQTERLRSLFSFGDNHRCREKNWMQLVRAIKETMRDILNERIKVA
jgi:mannose/cellobiose epimerase-like protein (N-acyl-D-glucosamine 2-epimerase family)